MDLYAIAAVWVGLAFLASLISIRIGVAVALVELLVGAVVGNVPGHAHFLHQTQYTDFLATAGSVVLTFLAGAEVDPVSLRRHWRASLTIGSASFVAPFAATFVLAYFGLDWDLRASEVAGVALAAPSVAVIYSVMIETGLNRTELGKIILSACLVTNLATVLVLGALTVHPNWELVVFVVTTVAVVWLLPRVAKRLFVRVGGRVSEPEIKFLLVVLFGLGALAVKANSQPVLPAYLVGLAVASLFVHDRVVVDRMRAISFALFTPFFFLRAGMLVDVKALLSGLGVIVSLLLVQLVSKVGSTWPLTSRLGMPRSQRAYTTLLLATGLTFGLIAALFGLTHGRITQHQYSELVAVVLLSAFVPTLIAQRFFQPDIGAFDEDLEQALEAEDAAGLAGWHRSKNARPRAD